MAEVINTNVFDAEKKFVDFAGLDYFWEKARKYVDDADKSLYEMAAALEGVVGDSTKGLVKDVKSIQDELNSLSGGVGSIATQIDNAIAALDLPNTYEAKGEAAKAEAAAKAYADGLVTVDGVAKFDAAGTAKGLNDAMDTRVKALEAIDHDKIAADAAAAAVAGVIDEAPESFDTLKEVAAWIANNDHASDVATLMTDVENLKKIDHDAYVEADKTVLADAKSYAKGLVMVDGAAKFDAAGAAAQALADAKADAASLYQPKGDYEAVGVAAGLVDDLANGAVKANTDAIAVINGEGDGSIAKAKADAIAQAKADAAETLKSYYTSEEVDGLVDALNGNIDSAQAAAESYAKTYTDALFTSFKFAANSDIDALFA